MPYTAASVANAFLSRAYRDKKTISPMKMQKLLYLTQGYSLVFLDTPAVNELFEAWKFGPVLSSLYHECKRYGGGHISNYVRDIDPETGEVSSAPIPDDIKLNKIIDFVWDTYGDTDAMKLSDWTHVKGGPWDTVTKGGTSILRHQDVPNDLIAEFFRTNLKNG